MQFIIYSLTVSYAATLAAPSASRHIPRSRPAHRAALGQSRRVPAQAEANFENLDKVIAGCQEGIGIQNVIEREGLSDATMRRSGPSQPATDVFGTLIPAEGKT